jgi:ubiquinone/menaquinone biosynthesis C-methylase UbiE
MEKKYPYTWEQAIEILRNHPEHKQIVYDAYLTTNLFDNVKRFSNSEEFKETLRIIREVSPSAKTVLDIPAGNGIASYAFAKNGYQVTSVDPDDSETLGRKAIRNIFDKFEIKGDIINSYGENLPFKDNSFDIVYVRQGLHHAMYLNKMVAEYYRVLNKGGFLIACREHVVDNKQESLQAFLDSQVDHQLYGGENAFTLNEYLTSMNNAGFKSIQKIKPYESPINLHPNTKESLSQKILDSAQGQRLSKLLPKIIIKKIGLFALKISKRPGRLYSFVAQK